MSQRADADAVDPRFGDRRQQLQCDAPGSLQNDIWSSGGSHATRFAELVESHVVDEHNVGIGWQDTRQLLQGIDFDSDRHLFAFDGRICVLEKLTDFGDRQVGRVDESSECQMIVFDEDGIEQAGAMIGSTTASDGKLLKTAPPRRRFPRVEDADIRTTDTCNKLGCVRGDATQSSHEIENRPFGGQYVSRVSSDSYELGATDDGITIFGECLGFDRQLHRRGNDINHMLAAKNAILAGDNGGLRFLSRGHQCHGCPVLFAI